MASSFYSNAQHVDFESVLSMDDHGMVSMFEALMASGLRGFLGCPAVVYEDALVDFFENASVRSRVIISTVGGQLVEISEERFAKSFELPVDGFGDLSEIPKDSIFDARSIVSLSGEPISLSGRKNQMKMPVRLLCDIMAKAISVKASILKKMVSPGSKQAKGFSIKISLLLVTFPSLLLCESSEFPASKVLTKKTVHRFVSIHDRDGAEEVTGAAKKKAVSKKIPAADVGAAVPKKKRTFKKKSISSISSLELVEVAEEAIPFQQVAEPSADDVDVIIQQVLDETRAADAPADTAQPAVSEEKHWFDLPYDDLVKQWDAERPVVTVSDTEEDQATVDVSPADGDQQVQESVAPISADDTLSADEQMSLDDILLTIPIDIPLPSSCMEITKITMGKSIKIPGVSKWTWFLKSLPCIPAEDKGKEDLVEKDPVKGNPVEEHYSLICADIELLVNLRAQVIDEVATFFHSFSLKKLATINFEEIYRKEEQVLSWGETKSPQEAIQQKFYILLKYRTVLVWKFLDAWRANFVPGQGSSAVDIQVIELLSDLYLSFLEELAKEARAHRRLSELPCWNLCLAPTGITRIRLFSIDCGSLRQSDPRPEPRLLRHAALETLTRSARTDSPRRTGQKQFSDDDRRRRVGGGGGGGVLEERRGRLVFRVRVDSRIQLAVGPQPLWLRNHNSGLAQRIMVKRLATSPHDPLGITDSACKNQSVVVSVQYGPFNPYIPIRSTTIGKSRVAIDPIAMHTSWRSNSDITSATR
ncbi:hypothetical protein F511_09154 [Dorcoceras hygrometricum]|uniref:Dystroglycan-like n=1 Tax=Dorcoceras hygrometricum TaxID=472368 RepID=A0A2Z7ANY3_9LAMI|nr:hypothetical protein F511_09154 [Dorcoceras hygrometricum]